MPTKTCAWQAFYCVCMCVCARASACVCVWKWTQSCSHRGSFVSAESFSRSWNPGMALEAGAVRSHWTGSVCFLFFFQSGQTLYVWMSPSTTKTTCCRSSLFKRLAESRCVGCKRVSSTAQKCREGKICEPLRARQAALTALGWF